jgi:predicted peptidase
MNYKLKIAMAGCFMLSIALRAQEQTIQSELKKETNITVNMDYKYRLELPENIADDEQLPLLVFLHGSGERGDSIDFVKVHGPWEFLETHPEYRFIILAPQYKTDEYWDMRSLGFLIDDIVANYPVDTTRIYLTGLSMGGYGTWDLAMFDPDRFAAIASVCGTTFQQKLMQSYIDYPPKPLQSDHIAVQCLLNVTERLNKRKN